MKQPDRVPRKMFRGLRGHRRRDTSATFAWHRWRGWSRGCFVRGGRGKGKILNQWRTYASCAISRRILLPKGEGGPKGRMRGKKPFPSSASPQFSGFFLEQHDKEW